MSNNTSVQEFFNRWSNILETVEQVLTDWTGEGCLQMSILLGTVSAKLNWDDKEIRARDLLIREYVRHHPHYLLTQGARGGIMRRADKDKKEQARLIREQTKAEIKAMVEAEVASRQVAADVR